MTEKKRKKGQGRDPFLRRRVRMAERGQAHREAESKNETQKCGWREDKIFTKQSRICELFKTINLFI